MRKFLAGMLFAAVVAVGACQSVIADEPHSSSELTAKGHLEEALIASPNGLIEFKLTSEGGIPRYSVKKATEQVIQESRLGLRFAEGVNLDSGFHIASIEMSQENGSWEQPWGEKRVVEDIHNELVVNLSTEEVGQQIVLRVRVFDDGVGFRYEIPDNGKRTIVDELTEFSVDPDATTWWTPAGEFNRYEYIYKTSAVKEFESAHTPLTIRLNETNTHIAIHEAALIDYSGMWLDQRRAGVLEADLAPRFDGSKVVVEGAFKTPWRVIQISDSAEGLINGTDIYLNLNEPNKLGDVSYFKPGKYVGIWWGMHINTETWGSGPKHGATTENTMKYIDFAAENGFTGVLVEGWNIGWDGDWFHNGDLFSFTESYPDFDLEKLGDYAREKGVHIIGHHETSGNISNYEDQLEGAFDLYEKVGVPLVKTGYVADAGDLKYLDEDGNARYTWHASQERVNHDLHVLKRAHEHQIAINAHEPVKDTGLRRTYPNAVSREGARGMEFNAWGTPPNPPEHQAIVSFTRMLSGPFDFTPGVFDLMPNGEDDENRVPSTLAKQLALYVTIYSPIQMVADLPENYLEHSEAFQFIRDVPTDWEQSIALDGEVGDYVVVARQERGGEDWFVGAVSDEEARTIKIDFDFLDDNRAYRAEIYRDGDNADWQSAPYDIEVETFVISAHTVMELRLAAGGGGAIKVSPIEPASDDQSEYKPMKKIVWEGMGSDAIPSRDVTILLPADYDETDAHYPVLYMHDGKNLFEPGRTITGDEWRVDETLSRMISQGAARPAIVVAIDQVEARWREYAPEEFVNGAGFGAMNESTSPYSNDYLKFIVERVKPKIDSEFRTLSGPEDTMLMGSSMGGLISLYGVSSYPDTFGAAACLSTHWPLALPVKDNQVEVVRSIQASLDAGGIDPLKHRFWFDHGTLNLDSHYAPYQIEMDAYFAEKGFGGIGYVSRVYEGTDHNEASWATRLSEPLAFLLGQTN